MRLLACIVTCFCALPGCSDHSLPPADMAAPDLALPDMTPLSKVPLLHRPTAAACPSDRPAFDCHGPDAGFVECQGDSTCTQGKNGRCAGNPHDGCHCSYDTCASDADCPSGTLCACRHRWHYGPSGPNECLKSNCRVDSDCGPGGYCSPSLDWTCGAYDGVTGWYCHTAKDTCVNDSDCVVPFDAGFGPPFCGYHPEAGAWACSLTHCAG